MDFNDRSERKMTELYHRGQDPRTSTDIVLWADDRDAITSYGDIEYILNADCLINIPDWVQDYAENFYSESNGTINANPDNIIDSADVWDDRDFVSKFWEDNEDTMLDLINSGIYGFKTADGAITFANAGIPVIIN